MCEGLFSVKHIIMCVLLSHERSVGSSFSATSNLRSPQGGGEWEGGGASYLLLRGEANIHKHVNPKKLPYYNI